MLFAGIWPRNFSIHFGWIAFSGDVDQGGFAFHRQPPTIRPLLKKPVTQRPNNTRLFIGCVSQIQNLKLE
jgi:hypothetical protein